MVNVQFEWENKKRADHKRSYDISRRKFLAGEMGRGWRPRNPGYAFESFENYQRDLEKKVGLMIESEIANVDPKVEDIRVLIYGTGDYETLAHYRGTSKDGKKVGIGLKLDNVCNAYSDQKSELQIEMSIRHEFMHHLDRQMIRKGNGIRFSTFGPKPFRIDYWNPGEKEGKKALLKYLMAVRTEGFAEINEGRGTLSLSCMLVSDKEGLRKQTAIASEGLAHLSVPVPKVRKITDGVRPIDVACDQRVYEGWRDKFLKLRTERLFSPYEQGKNMFAVITVAERQRKARRYETKEERIVFSKEVMNEVLQHQTFEDFYNYYYRCAESIGLKEDEVIIRPGHAWKLVDAERKSAHTPEERIKQALGIA